jgi:fermentation-respiration switch protein FrsA (DUF1100 family)
MTNVAPAGYPWSLRDRRAVKAEGTEGGGNVKRNGRAKMLRFLLLLFLLFAGARFLLPRVVFMPTADLVTTPGAHGIPFRDVTVTTSDGVGIHGWYVPAKPAGNARGTLLFFHGNAGNISWRIDSIKFFHDLGLSVFIIDYRGYGQSGGAPSIPGTALDALAAWRWLTEENGTRADEIVVFGRSLGGAVAVELTRSVRPHALILESTFSSLSEMIRPAFLTPIARLVTGDAWNSAKTASALTVPTLCIHSPDDRIVPYRLGKRLYDAAAGEKTFVEIRGDHNEGFLESFDTYLPALDAFLVKYLRPSASSVPSVIRRRYSANSRRETAMTSIPPMSP